MSNKLEQLEFKLKKNLEIRNMQEKLENDIASFGQKMAQIIAN